MRGRAPPDARRGRGWHRDTGAPRRRRASCGSSCRSAGTARPRGGAPGSGPGSCRARRRRGGSRRSWRRARRCPPPATATTASRSAASWGRLSVPTGRSGWIRDAPQRLVGVDVAHPRDALLGEQERLRGRAAPGRQLAQPLGGELRAERLHPEPSVEVGLQRVVAEQHDAPCRSGAGPRTAAADRRSSRIRTRRWARPGSSSASETSSRLPVMRRCITRATSSSSSSIRYLPRRATRSIRRPRTASASSAGAAGSDQRGSSTSIASRRLPSRAGASWRRIVSTSGSSGISPPPAAHLAGHLEGRLDRTEDRAVEAVEVLDRHRQLDHVLGAALVDVQAAGAQPRPGDRLVAHQLDGLRAARSRWCSS